MSDDFYATQWPARWAHPKRVHLKQAQGRLQVAAPYHPDFPALARELGGRWRKRSRIWSFPLDEAPAVREAIATVYGEGAIYG